MKFNSEGISKNPARGNSNTTTSPFNESLSTPGGAGQSAFISRERAQGGIFQNNALKQTHGSIDMVSPRNAIGSISGVINNQQSQYSNVMNRRKSNAMNSTHGPVDITAMVRSQRNPSEYLDQSGIKKNVSSSRGRNPQINSS